MRRYDIIQDGIVVGQQEHEDSFAPVLHQHQTARLTHVDGEPVIQGEPLKLNDAEREALPDLGPADTEMGIVDGERSDDARPGEQIEPHGTAPVEPGPVPEGPAAPPAERHE